MYEINPNKANTDDLKINQGSAQVFNPIPYQELALKKREFDERAAAAKAAQKEKKDKAVEDKVQAQLAGLKYAVNPRDNTHFANLSKDLISGTEANIDLLKKGDPAATAQFRTAVNNYNAEIANSNAAYKDYLTQKTKVETKGVNSFYPETMSELNNWQNDENAGVYKAPVIPQEIPKVAPDKYALDRKAQMENTTDTNGHPLIKNVSRQEADEEAVKMSQNPEYTYHFMRQATPGHAAELPENELNKLTVPSAYDAKGKPVGFLQLTHDPSLLESQPDKYAPASIENIAKAQVGKVIESHLEKQAPVVSVAQQKYDDNQKIQALITPSSDGSTNVVLRDGSNKPLTTFGVVPGTKDAVTYEIDTFNTGTKTASGTRTLTKAEDADRKKAISINEERKNKLDQAIKDKNEDHITEEQYNTIAKNNAPVSVPHESGIVPVNEINYTEVQKAISAHQPKDKQKASIYDIINENVGDHITIDKRGSQAPAEKQNATPAKSYSAQEESGINAYMKAHSLTRDEAVNKLIKGGRLK